MWVKLLQRLRIEGNRIVPAGKIVWLRRAACIVDSDVYNLRGDPDRFRQDHSVMTLEIDDEFILVLPDAEGILWEPAEEPR